MIGGSGLMIFNPLPPIISTLSIPASYISGNNNIGDTKIDEACKNMIDPT